MNLFKDMGYEYVYIPVIEVDWLEGGYKMVMQYLVNILLSQVKSIGYLYKAKTSFTS